MLPAQNESSRRLGRRSLASVAGAVVSGLGTLVSTVLITTISDQAVAGGVFAITSFLMLLQAVGRLGNQASLVWALTWVRQHADARAARTILTTSLLPGLLLGLLLSGVIIAAAPVIADLFTDDADTESMTQALRWGATLVPVAAVYDGLTSATQGLGRLAPTVVIERLARPVAQVVCVAAAVPTNSPGWLTVAWFAPYLPAFAIMTWILAAELRAAQGQPEGVRTAKTQVRARMLSQSSGSDTAAPPADAPPREWRRWYWRFSLPRAVSDAAQTALQRLDIVLVGALASLEAAAVYTVVTRLLVAGTQLAQSLLIAAQPAIAEAFAGHDTRAAETIWRRVTTWQITLTTPLSWMLAVQPAGILALFGDDYTSGTPAVVILALAAVVARTVGPVDGVLVMSGRSRLSLYLQILALATYVITDLALIPVIGITGAAVGWAAAILVANLGPLLVVRASLSINPWGYSVLTAAGLAAVVWGALFGLITHVWEADLPRLVIVGLFCGALYGTATLLHTRRRAPAPLAAPLPSSRG